eukprot:CAMPEP_0116825814 /NCGR_PEP_ID=MMETSP0418-20121206/2186_1 /TAXON_ID=1158023 /ORGANISM="Astrosyne radiata, Strain 13vi08-1A" /LENGTH=73 /DNA_ID=CAMNT_0004454387 /DNA_START=91 /DNA_END=312 /DNA_ORIENTATION=-
MTKSENAEGSGAEVTRRRDPSDDSTAFNTPGLVLFGIRNVTMHTAQGSISVYFLSEREAHTRREFQFVMATMI